MLEVFIRLGRSLYKCGFNGYEGGWFIQTGHTKAGSESIIWEKVNRVGCRSEVNERVGVVDNFDLTCSDCGRNQLGCSWGKACGN